MNFGINQRNTRRTAVVMLFVWMMSLMLGFANACVLDNDHRSLRHVFVASTHANESKGESSRGVGSRDASVGLGACESFCSAQETGILKYPGNTALIDLADASFFPLLIQTWINPATNFIEPQRFEDSALHWSAPPVHIRFLRLTI